MVAAPCRSAPSAQGRASGQGARRKRPPGGGAGKRGGGRRWRRRERFARDEANGDGAVGDGAREHPTLANDPSVLDACIRAAGRSWWGKADLAGGRVQGAGGELSRTHVCERMPSHLIPASP